MEADEVGKLFSVLSLSSAFISSVIGTLFQQLYNKTLETFPESFLLVTTGLFVAMIPCFLISYVAMKTFKSSSEENISDTKEVSVMTKF